MNAIVTLLTLPSPSTEEENYECGEDESKDTANDTTN